MSPRALPNPASGIYSLDLIKERQRMLAQSDFTWLSKATDFALSDKDFRTFCTTFASLPPTLIDGDNWVTARILNHDFYNLFHMVKRSGVLLRRDMQDMVDARDLFEKEKRRLEGLQERGGEPRGEIDHALEGIQEVLSDYDYQDRVNLAQALVGVLDDFSKDGYSAQINEPVALFAGGIYARSQSSETRSKALKVAELIEKGAWGIPVNEPTY